MEIFTKKGFRVIIPAQPLGIITWRLHNIQVMISGGCATSEYRNLDNIQPTGNDTWKLLEEKLE